MSFCSPFSTNSTFHCAPFHFPFSCGDQRAQICWGGSLIRYTDISFCWANISDVANRDVGDLAGDCAYVSLSFVGPDVYVDGFAVSVAVTVVLAVIFSVATDFAVAVVVIFSLTRFRLWFLFALMVLVLVLLPWLLLLCGPYSVAR